MREIKFRGWLKELKQFRYFSLNDPDWYDQEGEEVRNGCVGKWDQFTGLKDKNGKEIYEGDICKSECANNHWCTFIIEWNEEECSFVCKYISEDYDDSFDYLDEHTNIKVIGDKYQNPELLK